MRLPVISLCFHSIVPFFARSIVSTAGRSVVTIDNNNIKVPGNGIVSWLPPLLRIVRVCFCFCILYAFEIYGDPIFGCCINKQWQSSDVMHIQTKCFCWRWVLQIRREMRAYDNPIFSFYFYSRLFVMQTLLLALFYTCTGTSTLWDVLLYYSGQHAKWYPVFLGSTTADDDEEK